MIFTATTELLTFILSGYEQNFQLMQSPIFTPFGALATGLMKQLVIHNEN